MKTIFLFLITGFEEIEALATVDVLRRAGLPVRTVSLTDERTVTGSHGIPVVADGLFEETDFGLAEMLVIPGGTPAFDSHEGLKREVQAFYDKGGRVATDKAAVVDGNVITGRGPGLTLDFALTLVEVLAGEAKRHEVASQLLVG
mgnify:CR=1 FL=1